MITKKDIYKVLIGILIGVIITLALQKGISAYKYKQFFKKPSNVIMQLGERMFKKALPEAIVKNIDVGSATEKELQRENINVKNISTYEPPFLLVEYEVYDKNDDNLSLIAKGVPYDVYIEYEIKGVIKKMSFIIFYNPEDNSMNPPGYIDLLKKDREAEVLFAK